MIQIQRLAMTVCMFLAAASIVGAGAAAQEPSGAKNRPEVIVGPEDTITVIALNSEETSGAWRVSSSGELNLPMLGRIQAAGMPVTDLEKEISKRLRKYLHEPQVTVYISEYRSQPVRVLGAVNRPGEQQLAGSKTLTDVLVQAGGVKDPGPTLKITRKIGVSGEIPHPGARRDVSGQLSVLELDVREVTQGRGGEGSMVLKAHDVVTVSELKRPRLIHVTGEVARPGAIELVTEETISLSKAIAVAGGLTKTASPKKSVILHVNAEGVQTASASVDLKKVLSGKVRDIDLAAGDIVVVPSSQLMTYLGTAATAAISSSMFLLGRF